MLPNECCVLRFIGVDQLLVVAPVLFTVKKKSCLEFGALTVAAGLPMVPVVLFATPANELIGAVLKMLE